MSPVNNTEFSRDNDFIEITTDEFTIRVSSCFLLTNAAGKFTAQVLSGDGSKFRSWNGMIYSGNVVYLDGTKFNAPSRFQSIINFRNNLIESWKSEQ